VCGAISRNLPMGILAISTRARYAMPDITCAPVCYTGETGADGAAPVSSGDAAAVGVGAINSHAVAAEERGGGTKRPQVTRTPEKGTTQEGLAASPSRPDRVRRRLVQPAKLEDYDTTVT
jgi:hypothetical protein